MTAICKLIATVLVSLISLTLIGCAPPALSQGGQVAIHPSTQKLQAQGKREFDNIKRKKKISYNASYRAQLDRVTARLTPVIQLPGAQWEFVIFDDDSPNAFALPGGKVGIHTGLFQITQNDAGLAAVIGHEIAHVTSNHAGKQQKQNLGLALGGVLLDQVVKSQGASSSDRAKLATVYGAGAVVGVALPHSRQHELEADRIGAIFMARAGYNPQEAVALWRRFAAYNKQQGSKTPAFLRTHPLDETRVQALEAFMPVAMREYKPR